MIQQRCLSCQKKVNIPESYVGRGVKCPGCGAGMLVEDPAGREAIAAISSARREASASDERGPSVAETADFEQARGASGAEVPSVSAAVVPPPLPPLPTPSLLSVGEMLRQYPKIVAAAAITELTACLSLLAAVFFALAGDGITSLICLGGAVVTAWEGLEIYRLRLNMVGNLIRWHVGAIVLFGFFLVTTGGILFVLLILMSVATIALLRSGVPKTASGMAEVVPQQSPQQIPAPVPIAKPAVIQLPPSSSSPTGFKIWWRNTKAVAGIIALAVILGLWGSGTFDYLTPPEKLSFSEVNDKCGIDIVRGFVSLGRTSEQQVADGRDRASAFSRFRGTRVHWRGAVMDVRNGQILIKQGTTNMTNEVVLIPFFWEKDKLPRLNVGDVIEYSGTLTSMGDPYPFGLTNGSILSTGR